MRATEIADGVYWVGAVDWSGRSFHGYATPRGTSYNSYLIVDESVVLVDAVKSAFLAQTIERISSVVDVKDIDVIVSNHSEPDHSSGLPALQSLTGAEIVASRKGAENLPLNFGPLEVRAVGDGDVLPIGRKKLSFIETPMLHWPDSMFSYLEEDGILFSMDGFGQHFASSRRFDDEVDEAELMDEAATYYANILLPFGGQVQKALEKLRGRRVNMLATAHGLIWRKNVPKILEAYEAWSTHRTQRKAVIAYDTMWGSTQAMAEHIADGIAAEGAGVKVMRITGTERSAIMKEVMESSAVLIGGPTLNNGAFPTVADLAVYLRGLRPKGRIGAVFGSYGWAGGSSRFIRECLQAGGVELPFPDLDSRFAPDAEVKAKCRALGREVAQRINAMP
jgi:flavorubredoxin